MIVFILFFVVTIGLIISMSKIDEQTEGTTTVYTATIRDVDITDTGKRVFAEIHTNEYTTALQISTNICQNIEIDKLRELGKEEQIFFAIENSKMEQMNQVEFINIISLETSAKGIFSIEEYNTYLHNSAHPARIISIVMALLFLFMSLRCCLKIKEIKSRNK